MKKIKVLLPAILGLSLVACSTGPAEPESLADKLEARNYIFGEPVDRISNHRINGWNYIDRRNVIISAGVSDKYLLVLRRDCFNLQSANTLAFTSSAGSLTNFDRLIVSGPGNSVDRCFIQDIYRVERMEPAGS